MKQQGKGREKEGRATSRREGKATAGAAACSASAMTSLQ